MTPGLRMRRDRVTPWKGTTVGWKKKTPPVPCANSPFELRGNIWGSPGWVRLPVKACRLHPATQCPVFTTYGSRIAFQITSIGRESVTCVLENQFKELFRFPHTVSPSLTRSSSVNRPRIQQMFDPLSYLESIPNAEAHGGCLSRQIRPYARTSPASDCTDYRQTTSRGLPPAPPRQWPRPRRTRGQTT